MCLIFTNKPTDVSISTEWLNDFYEFNSDGWGFMYFDKNLDKVCVHKALGTKEQWVADFRAMEALQVPFVTHLRMRTHGATDLENVHPYEVNEGMFMMHNGILSTGYGSSGDTTKSDTWHYVRDHIHPMLEVMSESSFLSKPMRKMIGSAIGNNRFVFMTKAGHPIIVNKSQGKTWYGRWMSNTYAWSSALHISPAAGPVPKTPTAVRSYWATDDEWTYGDWVKSERLAAAAAGRTWPDKALRRVAELDLVDIEANEAAEAFGESADQTTISSAVRTLLKPKPHVQTMTFKQGLELLAEAGYSENIVDLAEAVANQLIWNNETLTELDEDVDYILLAEYAMNISLFEMSNHLADQHVYLSSLQEVMGEAVSYWEIEDTPQDGELSTLDSSEPSAV